MPARLKRGWPLAAIVLLTLLFFNRLAFTDLILARGDTYAYFYPYWDARNAALSQGRIPLWTPDLFMGAPLLANPQIGTFYPPNWPLMGFSAPDAVRLSILLHIAWGMAGAYLLARRTLALQPAAALLTAALFALGGHVGAHVEQINQLQGLAWMPWLFLALHGARRDAPRGGALLAMGLVLQFFSGHTQTVFITAVGLGLVAVLAPGKPRARRGAWHRAWRREAWHAMPLPATFILAGILALVLAAPQLIPTLELAGVSRRGSGLTAQQALAFSLSPFVAGRGLLPSYDSLIFGEYVAYPGVIGLGLALMGLARRREAPQPHALLVWAIIALAGLLFAFGLYNPLYVALAGLPGFNLFRVPARWLALFALGTALLAGWGLQAVLDRPRRPAPRIFGLMIAVSVALVAASFLATREAESIIGSGAPTGVTLAGWGAALLALLTLLWTRKARWLLPAALVELLLASQIMAYNDLAPPDVYSAQRLTISQLRAYNAADAVPGRVLSISNLLFDPGDGAALEARYRALGLDDLAVRHALVATKMREVLAANLPLTWGVPTVDGFDGGLLPTVYYSAFTTLLLPPDEAVTQDGRLRELLAREECRGACVPDARWLGLTGTRYLITDKIFDLWREDVAYDTQFERPLRPGEAETIRALPPFAATALDVLYACDVCAGDVLAVTLSYAAGETERVTLTHEPNVAALDGFYHARLPLRAPRAPAAIRFTAVAAVGVRAMTLVDTRTGDFAQLTLGPWRRALSSDIKLYENLAVLPRAFVVGQVDRVAGTAGALALMRQPGFDPARTAVLVGTGDTLHGAGAGGAAHITEYGATRVEVQVEAAAAGYLILSDAYYPGWQARVNGQRAPVERADVMFRAVRVPAGESSVVFSYRPAWWPAALIAGGGAWLLMLGGLVFTRLYSAAALRSPRNSAA